MTIKPKAVGGQMSPGISSVDVQVVQALRDITQTIHSMVQELHTISATLMRMEIKRR